MEKKIDITGWKGKDSLEIQREKDYYLITEHRKDKETGEINTQETKVSLEAVKVMLNIIDTLDVGETVGYRWIIKKLKEAYNLDVDTEAWNGGKNRSLHYFPKHYYPLKILEDYGKIYYGGRGIVTRLK